MGRSKYIIAQLRSLEPHADVSQQLNREASIST